MPIKAKKIRRSRPTSHRLPKAASGGVELLLVQSIEHLGNQGDVVRVKPGYAYNYLIPQGLATIATDHHKRMVEKHRAKLEAIERARQAHLKAFADKIGKQSITIEANATDDGHLYGSVGAQEIAAALKKVDIAVAPDQVKLEGPLKELGLYTVRIHVASGIDGELKVWVVPTVGAEEGK
jgi:large subunit ribosomal protein L9